MKAAVRRRRLGMYVFLSVVLVACTMYVSACWKSISTQASLVYDAGNHGTIHQQVSHEDSSDDNIHAKETATIASVTPDSNHTNNTVTRQHTDLELTGNLEVSPNLTTGTGMWVPENTSDAAHGVYGMNESKVIDEPKGWRRCQHPPCSRDPNCTSSSASTCCWELLQELLEASDSYLNERRVPYYVFWGTLLGSMRDGRIIPYTSDVDLVVEGEHLQVLEKIQTWNRRYYFWIESPDIGRMCIQDQESYGSKRWGNSFADVPVYVDVYVPLHVRNAVGESMTVFPVVPNCIFNTSLIYNDDRSGFTSGFIGNHSVPVPSEPKTLLSQIYGASWMTPDEAGGHGAAVHCPKENSVKFSQTVRVGRSSRVR